MFFLCHTICNVFANNLYCYFQESKTENKNKYALKKYLITLSIAFLIYIVILLIALLVNPFANNKLGVLIGNGIGFITGSIHFKLIADVNYKKQQAKNEWDSWNHMSFEEKRKAVAVHFEPDVFVKEGEYRISQFVDDDLDDLPDLRILVGKEYSDTFNSKDNTFYISSITAANKDSFYNALLKCLKEIMDENTKQDVECEPINDSPISTIDINDKTIFCVSDVRNYDELIALLNKNKFDYYNEKHVLLVLGSILTINSPIADFEDYFMSLYQEKRLILIKNDKDDLILSVINSILDKNSLSNQMIESDQSKDENDYNNYFTEDEIWFDILNREHALDYISILLNCGVEILWKYRHELVQQLSKHSLIKIVESSLYYYENNEYIFTHGWIPIIANDEFGETGECQYHYLKEWRSANNDTWYQALRNRDKRFENKSGKTIICSHGLEQDETLRIMDYRSPYSEAPKKEGDYIDIHVTNGLNCLIFKCTKGSLKLLFGKTKIGYFWICNSDILTYKVAINLDATSVQQNNVCKPTTNINDIWQNVSKTQCDGKYSSLAYDDICYGEIWYDFTTMWSKIYVHQFSNEVVEYRWGRNCLMSRAERKWRYAHPTNVEYTYNGNRYRIPLEKIIKAFGLKGVDIQVEKM